MDLSEAERDLILAALLHPRAGRQARRRARHRAGRCLPRCMDRGRRANSGAAGPRDRRRLGAGGGSARFPGAGGWAICVESPGGPGQDGLKPGGGSFLPAPGVSRAQCDSEGMDEVLAAAAERGFTLEERPLRGQWVWDGDAVTKRAGRVSSPNAGRSRTWRTASGASRCSSGCRICALPIGRSACYHHANDVFSRREPVAPRDLSIRPRVLMVVRADWQPVGCPAASAVHLMSWHER